MGSILLALVGLTRRFTERPSTDPPPRNALAGGAIVVLTICLSGLDTLVPHPSGLLAAWSAFHWSITERIHRLVPVLDGESVDNTVRYALLPIGILLLLGWRAGNLGCARSRKGTFPALVLWSALPLVGYGIAAAIIGHGKPGQLAHRFIIDVFRNGFAEELLFRGMLLSVVTQRIGLATGNVCQALLFGLWHLGADLRDNHVVWMALAEAVSTQAMAGYAYGKLTQRTGNILVAGTSHTLYDGGAIF